MPPQLNLASSFMSIHRHLLPIRESAQKAVLHAAKSVIRLSSSVGAYVVAASALLVLIIICWHGASYSG
jgi:hypothetical protein